MKIPLLALLPFAVSLAPIAGAQTPTMSKDQIIAEADKMAAAQLALFSGTNPKIDWTAGIMWAGYAALSRVSSNPAWANALLDMGRQARWTPIFYNPKAPLNADDIAICQAFLHVYAQKPDPAILAPTKSRMDAISDFIAKEPENPPQLTWWWCDALMMAPPGMARLSVLTHDPSYMAAVDTEWWKTAALLYDKDEHLFFRDKRFLTMRAKNGKKVFWSRGNGWVFAGLARLLPYVPEADPLRGKYIAVFKEMAAKLASLQQPDGAWRPSLLDPDQFPDSETSGTALDCFAFAWGINHGLLDSKTYLPVASKAWAALLAARRPDGVLGYVQDIADRPNFVKADGTKIYATGAFLMSAVELSRLAPLTIPHTEKLSIGAPAN